MAFISTFPLSKTMFFYSLSWQKSVWQTKVSFYNGLKYTVIKWKKIQLNSVLRSQQYEMSSVLIIYARKTKRKFSENTSLCEIILVDILKHVLMRILLQPETWMDHFCTGNVVLLHLFLKQPLDWQLKFIS